MKAALGLGVLVLVLVALGRWLDEVHPLQPDYWEQRETACLAQRDFRARWVGAPVMSRYRELRYVVDADWSTQTVTLDQPFSDDDARTRRIVGLRIVGPPLSVSAPETWLGHEFFYMARCAR